MIRRYLFIGLGNPGKKYDRTRHNIGFMWIDRVVTELSSGSSTAFKERFQSHWSEQKVGDKEVHFLKPQTYMNLSGEALRDWKKKYQGETRVFVVLDDVDLPFARLRLRARGRDAGHRGMRSIIEHYGTDDIPRLKIGVGRSDDDTVDHVLQKFSPDEMKVVEKLLDSAAEHFRSILDDDFEAAMNVVNGWTCKELKDYQNKLKENA